MDISPPEGDMPLSCYITVGRKADGGTAWLVVTPDQLIECCSGRRALEVLEAKIAGRRLPQT
jgi:hypothetical protein